MATKKGSIDFKELVISAAVTAFTVAAVNAIFLNSNKKGLGMPGRAMAFLPLEQQAKFADIVTAANVNNDKWLVEQLANVNTADPDFFKGMNNTSIGNCAFIALHSKNRDAREKCKAILELFKQATT